MHRKEHEPQIKDIDSASRITVPEGNCSRRNLRFSWTQTWRHARMANDRHTKRTHSNSQKIRLVAEQTSIKAEMLFRSKAWLARTGASENFPEKSWAKPCTVSLIDPRSADMREKPIIPFYL